MKESLLKIILFKMWHRVFTGQFDSRSFVGDTSLELRDILYGTDEDKFWKEYDKWLKEGIVSRQSH